MKSFLITIERSWESRNSEIAEREVIADLEKIWDPDEFTVHIEDVSKYDGLTPDTDIPEDV